jgi:hypothetical protein
MRAEYQEKGYKGISDPIRKLADKDRFLEVDQLMSREFYDYYRANRRRVVPALDKYLYFHRAISGLLLQIKRDSINYEHGVYIQNLFYVSRYKSHLMRDKRTPLKKYIQVLKLKIEFLNDHIEEKWKLSNTMQYTHFKLDKTKDYQSKKEEIEYYLETQKQQKRIFGLNKAERYIT